MLAPEGRPAGVFLLLGPTGTGKTKTVEALAEVLHGSPKKVLKIDCGEFQMEHEVAKLLGFVLRDCEQHMLPVFTHNVIGPDSAVTPELCARN